MDRSVKGLGKALEGNTAAKPAEIGLVAAVAFGTVTIGWSIVGDDPFARQAVVWVANVLMLAVIWMGLRLRGQGWRHFGLDLRVGGLGGLVRRLLLAVAVLVAALVAFVAGSVLMTPFVKGAPAADMSGYSYLQGNLPMFLLALAAVYVVSSFGEEAIYRGFLMTRLAELGGGKAAGWTLAVVVSAVAGGSAAMRQAPCLPSRTSRPGRAAAGCGRRCWTLQPESLAAPEGGCVLHDYPGLCSQRPRLGRLRLQSPGLSWALQPTPSPRLDCGCELQERRVPFLPASRLPTSIRSFAVLHVAIPFHVR